jgi:Restriction endonuclease S subunits
VKTAALGDIAEIVSGATPKTGVPEFWDGEVEWATPADLGKLDGPFISTTPRKITPAGVRSCATTVLPAGSVLLSSRAPIGHVAINTVPMATNQGFKSLIPHSMVDAKYLYYWLKSKTSYLQSLGNGATFKELSKKTTQQIEVPLPPLPEQRRIAAILDHADALRAKRRQVLAHLDSLTQSIFNDTFGGSTFDSVHLRDVVKWNSGHFLPAKNQTGGPHPVYGGNGVNGSHDEYMFEEPRLVVGRVGAYCGAVHVTQPFSWVTDNALVANLLRDDLLLSYLLPALTLANLNQYAGVSGQPSISGGKIGEVRLLVPPLDLQQDFTARVDGVNAQRVAVQRALAADDELFASLQSRAFAGGL